MKLLVDRGDEHRSIKTHSKQNYCDHLSVEADIETRTVSCSKCNRVIDAFDYVWSWACNERRFTMEVDILKQDISRLAREREELRREVSYMKSKKKRAGLAVDAKTHGSIP